jgi:pyruvate dehydrogenase E2 component (dihydrolipoamide acetyltransferase)
MPRLSDSMEEGTILAWLKSEGDEVAVGDELVEIETDKANMVYEADAAGTLVELVAAEGTTLAIGEVIARIGEPGERPAGNGAAAKAKRAGPVESGTRTRVVAAPSPPETSTAQTTDGRVKASPVARRMAEELGVELAALVGSGPAGRIVKADVERAASDSAPTPSPTTASPVGESASSPAQAGASLPQRGLPPAASSPPAGPTPAPSPETAKGSTSFEELTKLQSTVARRMAESKATAPHFYLSVEADVSRAVDARASLKASAGEGDVVPSFNDMIVKASAIALREYPRANGAYRDGRLELYSRVNVGVAVAARDALVVPTVFDADLKGLRQIATETRALAERVRDGTVTPPELSGGTFTVSNLGMFGISSFAAVINPPQAGILAVGAIEERPVVRDGEVTVGHLMSMTLACDHRILYGADGARFLDRIRSLVSEPLGLAV